MCYFSFERIKPKFIFNIKFLFISFFCILFLGCSNKQTRISVSSPSVYTEAQSLRKIFAGRRKKLEDLTKNIQAKEIQETFGVRQATQTDLSVTATPSAGEIVEAPEHIKNGNISLPNPNTNDGVGRPYSSLLRDVIARDQELLGWELRYLGDSRVHSKENRIVLLRYDVSINNYLSGDDWLGDKQFATIMFDVEPVEFNKVACDSNSINIGIYSLGPEFSSAVSQESIVTSKLESFAAQGGGTVEGIDITGAGRYQRSLENQLQTLVDQPLQFAIYDKNKFGFAFGPRRQIDKRSWIDPRRWFGNTYQITYDIEPGPRDVYAFLTVPKCVSKLKVNGFSSRGTMTQDFDFTNDGKNKNKVVELGFDEIDISSSEVICPTKIATNAEPISVFPALSNTFFISSPFPVTTETEATIGPVKVLNKNLSIMGRNQLQITIPPSKGLSQLLKKELNKQPIILMNPGQNFCHIGNVELTTIQPTTSSPQAVFNLEPKIGVGGEDVKLTQSNSTLNFKKIDSIFVAGKKAVIVQGKERQKDEITFRIPRLDLPIQQTIASINIKFNNGKYFYVPKKFTYTGGVAIKLP